MSRISEQITAAMSRIRTAKGEAVTYRRGLSSVAITLAVPADQQRRGRENDGTSVDANTQDWLISVAALVLDSVEVEPIRGDVITWDRGDVIDLYEVLPQDGDAVFHFSDSGRTQYRIHTRKMEAYE